MLPTRSPLGRACGAARGPSLFGEGWLSTVDDLRVVLQPIGQGHHQADDGLAQRITVRSSTLEFRDLGVDTMVAEAHERAISSYEGVGIPACQVGSRSSSRLPLGSKKYSSRPGKKPCSR
jgi:hypothetical protein